jgi:DnaK suppressor protein
MTTTQLHQRTVQLRDLRERLGQGIAELRNEALRPVGQESTNGTGRATVHDADVGARTADENLALGLLAPETEILAEVDAALDRVRCGTFGTCAGCGKAIAAARLAAVPYARLCIRCARAAE